MILEPDLGAVYPHGGNRERNSYSMMAVEAVTHEQSSHEPNFLIKQCFVESPQNLYNHTGNK